MGEQLLSCFGSAELEKNGRLRYTMPAKNVSRINIPSFPETTDQEAKLLFNNEG